MVDWNILLNVVTILLLGVGGYALFLIKEGAQAVVKTTAEETAKATIEQLKWPMELARELQKTRGVERQELRYKSYGALWEKLRPLAIYDEAVINRATVRGLSTDLSNWYFSECGGLLLTEQSRDFYFALQDLLRKTSEFPEDWDVERSGVGSDQKSVLREVLKELSAIGGISETGADKAIKVLEYISNGNFEDWQNRAVALAKDWSGGMEQVVDAWKDLDKKQRYATLQQAGSILRTALTTDLESRVR
jgi:hypothetical protein